MRARRHLLTGSAGTTLRVACTGVALIAVLSGCSGEPTEGLDDQTPVATRPLPSAEPTTTTASPTPTSAMRPLAVPDAGAYFGTHFSATLPDRRGTITALEAELGRQFAIDHVYHNWTAPFPSEYDRWTIAQGRTLFLSWTTRQSGAPTAKWADVAAGGYDDLIDERAAAIAALGVPVLMSFDHEPGAQVGPASADSGSAAEYRDAWRHVVERFRAAGVVNVSWVWTLTAYSFRTGNPADLYPGNDIVDWVGVDGYANIGCPWLDVPWRSWEEIFGAAHQFAAERGKPVVIAEFSAREDSEDPERKASWLREAVDAMEAMPQIKALVSFNSTQECSSGIASSPAATETYREIGAHPAFGADDPASAARGGATP